MKKTLFSLTLLLGFVILSSCSNIEDFQTTNNSQEKANEILEKMNKENPMSSIGIMHNLSLDKVMNRLSDFPSFATRRSVVADSFFVNNENSLAPSDIREAIREEIAAEYVEEATEYNIIEDYPLEDFLETYDSVVVPLQDLSPDEIKFVSDDNRNILSNSQISLLDQLESILKNDTLDLVQTLSQIDLLNQSAAEELPENELSVIYTATSMASNTCCYWAKKSVYSKQNSSKEIKINWKRAGQADVSCAIGGAIGKLRLLFLGQWQAYLIDVALTSAGGSAASVAYDIWNSWK